MAEFIGPAQNAQPIRSVIDLDKFLNADDVQITGTLARDGVYAEFRTFPTAHDLFGGAFDPAHAGWAAPVPDTWTHHIPADAPSGTYYLNVKGRRTYLGEDIPFSKTVEIQVGSHAAHAARADHRTLHQLPHRSIVARQGQPRECQAGHVRRLPRAARVRARGPDLRAHALHPLALERFDAPLDNAPRVT